MDPPRRPSPSERQVEQAKRREAFQNKQRDRKRAKVDDKATPVPAVVPAPVPPADNVHEVTVATIKMDNIAEHIKCTIDVTRKCRGDRIESTAVRFTMEAPPQDTDIESFAIEDQTTNGEVMGALIEKSAAMKYFWNGRRALRQNTLADPPGEGECGVCYTHCALSRLSCGHTVCEACALRLLDTAPKAMCPFCRRTGLLKPSTTASHQ